MKFVPAVADQESPREQRPRVALRLRAIRGALSIDLESPVDVGPLLVRHVTYSLPGLRFPVDLSGGVSRFRHRRGHLEIIEVEARLGRLAAALAPNAKRAWDSPALRLHILPSPLGLVIGLCDESSRALAFNATLAPDQEALRWIVSDARGVGIDTPAHALALRVAEAILGKLARRSGSVFSIDDAIPRLLSEVLIDAGARTPDHHGIAITSLEATPDGLKLSAGRESAPWVAAPQALSTVALARIAEQTDDALATGDLERARESCLLALEAAPRHPELALRLADLDLVIDAPARPALAALVETMAALDGGAIAARLLARVGDRRAASVAARRAAHDEPFAPLGALLFLEAAAFTDDTREHMQLLDEAVAKAPSLLACRWARALARLRIGDITPALEDFAVVEVASRGATSRFDVCARAANALLEFDRPSEAIRFFERSLRYAPRSIESTAGLARAYLADGQPDRGAALLARAVNLTRRTPDPHAALLLELGSALADIAKDLPAAIAQVRGVPFGLPQTVAARSLEGRWRSLLGDQDGASIAFAHAREAFEALPPTHSAGLSPWLLEAAEFEERQRDDVRTAFRHVEAALRVKPDDTRLQAAFRRLAARSTAPRSPHPEPVPPAAHSSRPVDPPHQAPRTIGREMPSLDDELLSSESASADDEERVSALTNAIRANPADHEAVLELCDLLARLDRSMDLFALVSARLEETSEEERRAALLPWKSHALTALADAARAAGHDEEASVYDDALAEMQNESFAGDSYPQG